MVAILWHFFSIPLIKRQHRNARACVFVFDVTEVDPPISRRLAGKGLSVPIVGDICPTRTTTAATLSGTLRSEGSRAQTVAQDLLAPPACTATCGHAARLRLCTWVWISCRKACLERSEQ